jgi:hypothetical protein
MAGLNFAIMLPFLVLAFASSFFRERLKKLLKLSREDEPPLISAVPADHPAE